jgi:hypothetical protein
MTAVAARLCIHVDNEGQGEAGEREELDQLLGRVNYLLDDHHPVGGGGGLLAMIHSMRMYFLKLLAQSRGVSFLRQALLTPPLNQAAWLQHWRDGVGVAATASGVDTIGFTRFLGSNLLPRLNPFVALPNYSSVQAQVAQVLQSGDIPALALIFASAPPSSHAEAEVKGQQARYLSGLLLLALFNEVALLSLLPMEAVQSQLQDRAREIEVWILSQQRQGQGGGEEQGQGHRPAGQTASPLAFLSPSERHCLIFFGLGRFSLTVSASTPPLMSLNAAQQRLLLSPSSPPSALLQVRVMTHLVASALMCPPCHPGHFLDTLIFRPGAMLVPPSPPPSVQRGGGEGGYLPTMPEDMMKMAQTVMGGRWYACPYGKCYYNRLDITSPHRTAPRLT